MMSFTGTFFFLFFSVLSWVDLSFYRFFNKLYLFILFVCTLSKEVRRQLTGIVSFLLLCGSQTLNQGAQAWQGSLAHWAISAAQISGFGFHIVGTIEHWGDIILVRHTSIFIVTYCPTAALCHYVVLFCFLRQSLSIAMTVPELTK